MISRFNVHTYVKYGSMHNRALPAAIENYLASPGILSIRGAWPRRLIGAFRFVAHRNVRPELFILRPLIAVEMPLLSEIVTNQ